MAMLRLIGMVLIGFLFADQVLLWIEKPLKDGLTEFFINKATEQFDGRLTPERTPFAPYARC